MPRTRKHGRIYWRKRGGVSRAYADFRDFADVGGGREALIPPGDKVATSDPDVAGKLVADRLRELEGLKRSRVLLGVRRRATLMEFVARHLVEKARAGRVAGAWIGQTETMLRHAVGYFGADRDLLSITVQDVQDYAAALGERGGLRGNASLSPGTVRHYLNVLSNLYRRAASEGYVPPGHNPVAAMLEKPIARRQEARWLEVPDAALLLESARLYRPKRDDIAIPCVYPLLATFLLTGGRQAEVLGLEVDDVSFDRKTITFRPNQWRRLKTATSHRTVPLWPQLEEILREYVFGGDAPPGRLLFPATRVSVEQPIRDVRKAIDAVAGAAGWDAGAIRSKMFRHTYCAARLQTLDKGAPVSTWTVAKELGHGGESMVSRVYGHLGDVRHRSEAVEYRVDQHTDRLRERLKLLA